MDHNSYLKAVERLPIKNPTRADIDQLCPHLSDDQRAAFWEKGDGASVACPPLKVRGAFQNLSLHSMESTRTMMLWMDPLFAGRVADARIMHPYMDEANAFAEREWSGSLLEDTWNDVVVFRIQDPTDTTDQGYPKTKLVLTVLLSRTYEEIYRDMSKPWSQLYDDAIVGLLVGNYLVGDMIRHEAKGKRAGHQTWACSLCASWLDLEACPNCGHAFKDDHSRTSEALPLSRKMVAFLRQQRHVFTGNLRRTWRADANHHELLDIAKAALT